MLKHNRYILTILILLFVTPQVESQLLKRQKKSGVQLSIRDNKAAPHIDIQTLTLDENINVPIVESPLSHRKIREYMAEQEKTLQKLKQYGVSQVELQRLGEVIKLTIPVDKLFYPNDTTLYNKVDLLLRPIARYGEEIGMYHILIVVHSDNTGSIEYNLNLTTQRAEQLHRKLKQLGLKTEEVVVYGMGGEEPLTDNHTMEKRKKNRRVEIYLVPGEEMIKLSLRGRLEVK
ncbi:MAG: OmpA family protein [Bacteroidaceae bacterium]|nr:OmpA family protein [Bacteroidaceae bacterium]